MTARISLVSRLYLPQCKVVRQVSPNYCRAPYVSVKYMGIKVGHVLDVNKQPVVTLSCVQFSLNRIQIHYSILSVIAINVTWSNEPLKAISEGDLYRS